MQRTTDTTRPWKRSEIIEAKWVDGALLPSSFFSSPLAFASVEVALPGAPEDDDAAVDSSPSGIGRLREGAAGAPAGCAGPPNGCACKEGLGGSRISPTSVTPSVLWHNCMNCRVVEGWVGGGTARALPPPLLEEPPLAPCCDEDPEAVEDTPDCEASTPGASMPNILRRWPLRSSGTSRRSSSWRLSRAQRRNSCESCCA
mmetsp:Transcript_93927/g.242691  ORF Transcript_93927/g.242691 Transcript_93927/m.242691 type:complete len:201 (+) Transcript_93927:2557-3159(+)